jgi:hypothetical protein
MLESTTRLKVNFFYDVDDKKIGRKYYCSLEKKHIPVVHIEHVIPPFIVCVGSKRYNGQLEENIRALHFTEGVDYFHFC